MNIQIKDSGTKCNIDRCLPTHVRTCTYIYVYSIYTCTSTCIHVDYGQMSANSCIQYVYMYMHVPVMV